MGARIVQSLSDIPPSRHVVTVGNFDGVHRGHQHLLRTLTGRAEQAGAASLVVTFDPLPVEVLRPERAPRRLTTTTERVSLIAACGVDTIVVQRFDLEFAAWSAREFVERVATAGHIVEWVVGADFAFGHDRTGSPALLRELGSKYGFAVTVVERVGGQGISSTVTRELVTVGDVAGAAVLLERPYTLRGRVVDGAHRGRTFGFPTANLAIPGNLVVPADGIYAGYASVDCGGDLHPALIYVGSRPTFDGTSRVIEVNLLDFSGDLYDRDLGVLFVEQVRADRRFESAEAMVRQMADDEIKARRILGLTSADELWRQAEPAVRTPEGVNEA